SGSAAAAPICRTWCRSARIITTSSTKAAGSSTSTLIAHSPSSNPTGTPSPSQASTRVDDEPATRAMWPSPPEGHINTPAGALSACGGLGLLGEPALGPADRLEVAVVEITHLDAVVEQHPVPLPVEPVSEDDLALGACRHPAKIHGRTHPIAGLQVDLTLVGLGEGMRLPDLHGVILADRDATTHVRHFGPPSGRRPQGPRPAAGRVGDL